MFDEYLEWIFGIGIVLVAILLVWVAIADGNHWATFQKDHHCRIVGKMEPSTGVGPAMGGKGGIAVVFIPGKTGYLCDDGITYWR